VGRVMRRLVFIFVELLALAALVGCPNLLQAFIYDSVLGVPYRREMAKMVPSPNTGSYGFAVDISGDSMIVGEHNRDGGKGGAWIYHRTSGETWAAGQLLPAPTWALGPAASNANDGDQYGVAVATNGDYAALGSMYAGANLVTPGIKRGQVVIYARDAATGTWSLAQTLDIEASVPGSTAINYDLFGCAISIDGSWMAIGARQDHFYDTGGSAPAYGAVYLFQNVGGTWTYKEKKTATVPQAGASFGFSVDLQSDLLIVGSHYEDIEGTPAVAPFRQGAAYIFRFDTDNWQFSDRLTAPDAEHMALFGVGVGISAGYAVVGAPLATVSGVAQAGAAYFFQRSAATDWHTVPAAKVTASNPVDQDWFGFTAAMKGDTAIVGGFLRDTGGVDAGEVRVYRRSSGNTWDLAGAVSPSDATDSTYFGISVSMDATRAVIGATAAPDAVDKGAVYLLK
jgi:hypothetical protein